MQVLLIRHAAAVPTGTPGTPDDERRLTPKGKAKLAAFRAGLSADEQKAFEEYYTD
jgi:phosphohistidine phosphatase SixA